jgi:DNA-binding beta-propeller fold protein YncE
MRVLTEHFPRMKQNSVVVFLTASVFCLIGFGASAIEIRYEKTLDLLQGREGKLRPVSVACDQASGEITITDARNSAIHVLNQAAIETFVTGRFASLALPLDAVADAQGRLVCLTKSSGWRNSISRLNLYGEPDTFVPEAPTEYWSPDHLIITRDGHYLTIEANNGFLVKHDSRTGRIIWTAFLGDESMNEAHLGRPLESPSGNILVPGGRLFQIFVLSPRGELIESFGRFGSSPGRLIFPVDVASGPDDTILVLDRLRHKILVFDADHAFVTEFGSLGSRPGQFYHPVSMAADGSGSIYVAQGYKGRVQVFNVLGNREN